MAMDMGPGMNVSDPNEVEKEEEDNKFKQKYLDESIKEFKKEKETELKNKKKKEEEDLKNKKEEEEEYFNRIKEEKEKRYSTDFKKRFDSIKSKRIKNKLEVYGKKDNDINALWEDMWYNIKRGYVKKGQKRFNSPLLIAALLEIILILSGVGFFESMIIAVIVFMLFWVLL